MSKKHTIPNRPNIQCPNEISYAIQDSYVVLTVPGTSDQQYKIPLQLFEDIRNLDRCVTSEDLSLESAPAPKQSDQLVKFTADIMLIMNEGETAQAALDRFKYAMDSIVAEHPLGMIIKDNIEIQKFK